MADEHEDHNKDDKSIVDALSTLGWVEEKEEESENLVISDDNLMEQLNFFSEENKKLTEDLNTKNKIISELEAKLEELNKKFEDSNIQEQAVQKLYETIEEKNDTIEKLNDNLNEKDQKISNLTTEIEKLSSEITESQELFDQILEKDKKVKELEEQLEYLQSDTIQKSKFEKVETLLEKKDEVITEKEKVIFELEGTIKSTNQKVHDLQQQLETFSLLKKDLEKKDERIKQLVVQNEELMQKNLTNLELIKHFEQKLEESQEKSGKITGKFEVELANLRSLLDGKDSEMKEFNVKIKGLEDKLSEAEKIEEKLLSDIQVIKDENLKLESTLEEKEKEVIELKKKIKVMRRDMEKS